MKTKIPCVAALLLISSYSFAGGFRLVPGEPLNATATIHKARGRQGMLIKQKLRFGPYYTTEVKRGWIKKWSGVSGIPGVLWADHMQGKQAIRFTLTNGIDTVEAETVSRIKSDDLIIGSNRDAFPNVILNIMTIGSALQENNFSAAFTQQSTKQSWHLFLDNTAAQLRRGVPAGFLRSEGRYYTIVPVWKVERKGKMADMPFGAAGLEFRDEEGKACAAVSLIDNGEVYLGDLPESEKLLLSAACSALLLQSNITE